MKVWLFILSLLGAVWTTQSPAQARPRLEKGLLDLSSWNDTALPLIPLQGTVEFHWRYFLQPGEDHPETQSWIRFPGFWNLVEEHPYHSFASYRFRVKLPKLEPMSIRFLPPWTAARYFVDGQLVHSLGQAGPDQHSSQAGAMRPFIYSFTPRSTEFEVLVHVSNFDLYAGGLGSGIQLGSVTAVLDEHEDVIARGLFMMGAIAIMGFYHIALFGLRRSDPSTLYYGIFCLMIAMHLSVADPSNPIHVFLNVDFTTQIRLYNIGWMFATSAFVLYSQQLFYQEMRRRIPFIITAISLAHVSFLLLTSVRSFILSTLFYQAVTVLACFYTIYSVFKAARCKREGARTFLIASFALLICTLNDMLVLQGLYQSPPLGSLGALIFTFGQSFLLSMRFSKAFIRAETSEAEVRRLADDLKMERDQVLRLNETLEERVEEQTRDIHSIMEHIPLGVFTIEGERQTIHKDYSKYLERLFEKEQLAGQSALELLFEGSTLAANDRDQVHSTLHASLGQSEINFFTNEHMLPHSLIRQRQDGDKRQLELRWKPIVKNDDVDKILVTVNDATEIRKLESMARENAEDLTIVGEILACKEDAFRRFLRNCREFNAQNRELIRAADPDRYDRETLKIIFMNMHTMKGAARTLQFKKLTEIFHDLEQYYSHLAKQEEASWDLALMQKDVEMIDAVADHYETLARDKLGRSLGDGPQVVLPFDRALQGFHKLNLLIHQDVAATVQLSPLHGLLQEALFNRLDKVLADILSSTASLAKDLNKPTPRIEMETVEFWVSHRAEDILRNTFVHLLRNSMDHGIEYPAERVTLGKKAEGLIRLGVEEDSEHLTIWFSDDGKGLNLRRLQTLGQARGLLPSDRQVSREEIAELIFASGISTAQTLTEISGRGVGMSAVRRYYQDVGGDITIHFDESRFTMEGFVAFRFRITLPLEYFSQPHPSMDHSSKPAASA
jgi:HPt (histidine-containing phosphotransfer) domain-containing protein